MAIFSRPRRLPTPAKPPTPPKPPAIPPKPKPTAPDVPDPNKPRASGFSPAGVVGGIMTAGAGIIPALASNPLRLAGGLAGVFAGIEGLEFLQDNPEIALVIAGVGAFVVLKILLR